MSGRVCGGTWWRGDQPNKHGAWPPRSSERLRKAGKRESPDHSARNLMKKNFITIVEKETTKRTEYKKRNEDTHTALPVCVRFLSFILFLCVTIVIKKICHTNEPALQLEEQKPYSGEG